MLVGGVVADELGDHPQAAPVRLADELAEVAHRAVVGVDAEVVGDVVAVVLERRRVERQQPDRRDAEVAQVVELLGQAPEVADPVAVAVAEGADVDLVDDRVLVPERIVRECRRGEEQSARSSCSIVVIAPAPSQDTCPALAGDELDRWILGAPPFRAAFEQVGRDDAAPRVQVEAPWCSRSVPARRALGIEADDRQDDVAPSAVLRVSEERVVVDVVETSRSFDGGPGVRGGSG